MTISPQTTSSVGISRTLSCPAASARRTRQTVRAQTSDSRAYAASEPCSDSVEISVAKKTASAMPPVSNQSAPRKANSRFSPRAHSRMRMTGSPRLARNLRQKPRRGFCVRRLLPPRRRDAYTSAGVRGWGCAEPAETAERVSVCIRYRPFLGRTSAGAGGLSRRGRGGDLWSVRLYAALVRFMPDFRRCRGAVCLQKRVFKNSK